MPGPAPVPVPGAVPGTDGITFQNIRGQHLSRRIYRVRMDTDRSRSELPRHFDSTCTAGTTASTPGVESQKCRDLHGTWKMRFFLTDPKPDLAWARRSSWQSAARIETADFAGAGESPCFLRDFRSSRGETGHLPSGHGTRPDFWRRSSLFLLSQIRLRVPLHPDSSDHWTATFLARVLNRSPFA